MGNEQFSLVYLKVKMKNRLLIFLDKCRPMSRFFVSSNLLLSIKKSLHLSSLRQTVNDLCALISLIVIVDVMSAVVALELCDRRTRQKLEQIGARVFKMIFLVNFLRKFVTTNLLGNQIIPCLFISFE